MSLFKGNNVSFLSVEVNGLVHSGLESVRDFLHRADHGGNLDI